ncbi:MAG: hypothetical protein AAF664_05495, partial [Planctomycetota bacterium]
MASNSQIRLFVVGLLAFPLLPGRSFSTVIDNFESGSIDTPTGRLDTDLEPNVSSEIIARSFVENLPESDVLGTTRHVVVREESNNTNVSTTAEILRLASGDSFLNFSMGAGGSGASFYSRPDSSTLADFFGSGEYQAFRFEFLEGTNNGGLIVSMRGDFPDGGNQIFAFAEITGPGVVDVPFSTLMGEFGGPPGRLGLPWQFFFIVQPDAELASLPDDSFNYSISRVSLVRAVPEPGSALGFGLLILS